MTKYFSSPSLIVGIMLGILLTGTWFYGNHPEDFRFSSEARTSSQVKGQGPESNLISVADQPAGDAVMIKSVTAAPSGVWIAVREVAGEDLGNVLGAARVGGPRENVSVPLLRATEPNQEYAVELYRDDNNGAFDPGANSVYVDFETGERVVVHFTTEE